MRQQGGGGFWNSWWPFVIFNPFRGMFGGGDTHHYHTPPPMGSGDQGGPGDDGASKYQGDPSSGNSQGGPMPGAGAGGQDGNNQQSDYDGEERSGTAREDYDVNDGKDDEMSY